MVRLAVLFVQSCTVSILFAYVHPNAFYIWCRPKLHLYKSWSFCSDRI